VQADTTNWQISNSLVRVAPNAAAGGFDISTFVATWKLKTYAFGLSAGAGLGGVSSVMVLRNSPEECSIRIASGGWFANTGRTYIDIALRRGDRLARFYVSSDVTNIWQIRRSAAEAGSAITFGAVTAGGIVATAADGNGEKYVMLSYQAVTVSDLVNGKLTLNAAGKTMDFAIGTTPSGAGAPDNAVSLAGQYLAAQAESQRIVAR